MWLPNTYQVFGSHMLGHRKRTSNLLCHSLHTIVFSNLCYFINRFVTEIQLLNFPLLWTLLSSSSVIREARTVKDFNYVTVAMYHNFCIKEMKLINNTSVQTMCSKAPNSWTIWGTFIEATLPVQPKSTLHFLEFVFSIYVLPLVWTDERHKTSLDSHNHHANK